MWRLRLASRLLGKWCNKYIKRDLAGHPVYKAWCILEQYQFDGTDRDVWRKFLKDRGVELD